MDGNIGDILRLNAHNAETVLSQAESADAGQSVLDRLAEASAAADKALAEHEKSVASDKTYTVEVTVPGAEVEAFERALTGDDNDAILAAEKAIRRTVEVETGESGVELSILDGCR